MRELKTVLAGEIKPDTESPEWEAFTKAFAAIKALPDDWSVMLVAIEPKADAYYEGHYLLRGESSLTMLAVAMRQGATDLLQSVGGAPKVVS